MIGVDSLSAKPTVFGQDFARFELPAQHAVGVGGVDLSTGQWQSAVTLLASHRCSTVRFAGLILVVDGDVARGLGSQDELILRDGPYAELCQLQARAYA